MRRSSLNIIPANVEAIKKRVKEAADQSQKQKDWRIADRPGLVLITRQTGAATWYYFYTPDHAKTQSKLPIGKFPDMSLAEATQTVAELRVRVAKGENPAAQQTAIKTSITFRQLAEEFLSSGAISARTTQTYGWTLTADVYPAFGDKPAAAVNSDDVARVCHGIQKRGSLVQARNTKVAIGGVFKYGRSNYHNITRNPAHDVPLMVRGVTSRHRTPSNDELARVWRGIDAADSYSFAVKAILKLCILTGQRRSEVAGARCDELPAAMLASDTPVWIIRASEERAGRVVNPGRMKNKTEQRVYLSRHAAAIFRDAMRECSDGVYFFPADTRRLSATRKGNTRTPHINGESVTRAMARLCVTIGIDDVNVHDMRRAIGNFLKDAGIGREVRDLILHHKDDSVDGKHYSASAKMEAQCREAWQTWADHVEKVVSTPVVQQPRAI
jgi:integrase